MNATFPALNHETTPEHAEKARLLLIDASLAQLQFLQNCLAQSDRELHTASSAAAALAIAQDTDLALILLAAEAPDQDGYALAAELRQIERQRDVPILFIAAENPGAEHLFQGYEAGATDYLIKPIQIDILNRKVNMFLTLRRHKQRLEQLVARRTQELQAANTRLENQLEQHIQMETALQEAEARYRGIFENAVEGIFQTTPDGHYISINPALARIYGYDSVADMFSNLSDISRQLYVDTSRREEFRRLMEQEDTVTAFESQVFRKNGEIIWISENARAVRDANHKLLYYEGMVMNITRRKRAEEELRKTNLAYSRFVPHELLRLLDKSSIVDVNLNDNVQKFMSILFCDIRGFTQLSERMTPKENFEFVNHYFGLLGPVVRLHRGFVDKYMGDSIMALFERSPDDAINAAIAMLCALQCYNEQRILAGQSTIQVGIGINSGMMMLGTIGENDRMEGTVISDAVNAASRIEGLTKKYGVSLLIGEPTLRHVADPRRYALRFVDRVAVRGKADPVVVYEIFDADPPELRKAKLAAKEEFEAACAIYHQGDCELAHGHFSAYLNHFPQDRVAQIYLQRCATHSEA